MRTRSLGERVRALLIVLTAAFALGFLYVFNPASSSLYPACPFLGLTGCYCPGCGSLRALHQITRGSLVSALGLNPLMVFSLPFLGYFFASQVMLVVSGHPLKKFFVKPVLIWALLVVIISYWLLRNIPAYPFSLLAP